jgi:hypothetical protein
MSRRSRRAAPSKAIASIPASVRAGIASFCQDNTEHIARMLDTVVVTTPAEAAAGLESVMAVNSLSAEMLLARFFPAKVLSTYCSDTLNKSGKGSAATLAARIAAVWAKPSFGTEKRNISDVADSSLVEGDARADASATSRTKRRKTTTDWRAPLFYWRGVLALGKSSSCDDSDDNASVVWKGKWVASEDGLPSDEQFTDESVHANTFDMSADVGKLEVDGPLTLQVLAGRECSFHGEYMLDQGDGQGHQTFRDISHNLLFRDDGVVAALGGTEFGQFVSLGRVEGTNEEDGSIQLTLARRYLDIDDRRCEWKTTQCVMDAAKGTDGAELWEKSLPWKCD